MRRRIHVEEILVYGQKRTSNKEILWALHMKKGNHMWSQSLGTVRERMEKMPWVIGVTVLRRFPSTIVVILQERKPLAIWQDRGRKRVVDEHGHPIATALPKDFSQFPILTGEKAPQYFADLQRELRGVPQLPRVKAASFLRSQRWNLYLEGGQVVKLPQKNYGKALKKLMKVRSALPVAPSIDLRFPDALIFDLSAR